MHVELSNLQLWLIYGCASIGLVIILRAFVFRTSFFGRALLCFSAGLALFSFLAWLNFESLINVLEYDGTNERDKHLLSNQEITVRYYYWYVAVGALALGSAINIIWLLYEKAQKRFIEPSQQARIFSLSFMVSCALILLVISLFTS